MRVLAVEDQPALLASLKQVLEEHGAEVTAASSATMALDLLRSSSHEQFDIIVSDLGLPDLDGYEFMRMVRGSMGAAPERMPAIALTAYAREEDRRKAIEQGYQVHLAKPYHVSDLVGAIETLYAQRPRTDTPLRS